MPWFIGIDEAGYGPNLGPLVQTAVGVHVPDAPPACDLWQLLGTAVRQQGGKPDGRLIIDDSKKVYGPAQGLKRLEFGVLAALEGELPATVEALLNRLAATSLQELRVEPWYEETTPVPVAIDIDELPGAQTMFRSACGSARVGPFFIRSRLTPAPLFNSLLDELDNKSNVLAHGLCRLLSETRDPDGGDEPIYWAIDRLGGKKYHAALIQNAFPEAFAETVEETDRRCVYRMNGRRARQWSFEVEADARHFTVAFASMVSKYLREVSMGQFNRFWAKHLPGIRPTAGYYSDAVRFYREIRPAMKKLGIAANSVWRNR
jgi:hypothetical protein